MYPDRVVSGMRPTGPLHLGHYHGALKNWVKMQTELPCLFFVADWHALTTNYDDPSIIEKKAQEAVKKLGSKRAKRYHELRTEFQQEGKVEALEQAKAMLDDAQNLSMVDRERLFGYLEGSRKLILVEPQVRLTEASRLP